MNTGLPLLLSTPFMPAINVLVVCADAIVLPRQQYPRYRCRYCYRRCEIDRLETSAMLPAVVLLGAPETVSRIAADVF